MKKSMEEVNQPQKVVAFGYLKVFIKEYYLLIYLYIKVGR